MSAVLCKYLYEKNMEKNDRERERKMQRTTEEKAQITLLSKYFSVHSTYLVSMYIYLDFIQLL